MLDSKIWANLKTSGNTFDLKMLTDVQGDCCQTEMGEPKKKKIRIVTGWPKSIGPHLHRALDFIFFCSETGRKKHSLLLIKKKRGSKANRPRIPER